ncbi:MAG: hypothetical protein ACIWVG_31245 [Gloeotrichia echinulata HAB0833]
MKYIYRQALLLTILFTNTSLQPASALVVDKYLQNSLGANYGYSGSLLDSTTKPISPARNDIRIIANSTFKLILNLVKKLSKQEPETRTFFKNMSRAHANSLQESIAVDVYGKISPSISSQLLTIQVQRYTDQAFQEIADARNAANETVEKFLRARKAKNGVLTNKDIKDAKLVAQKVIEKRLRDKKEKVVLSSGTTITAISGATVTYAMSRVQPNNNERNSPRNRYPIIRPLKIKLR